MSQKEFESIFNRLTQLILNLDPADLIKMSDLDDILEDLAQASPLPEFSTELITANQDLLRYQLKGAVLPPFIKLLSASLDFLQLIYTQGSAGTLLSQEKTLPDSIQTELQRHQAELKIALKECQQQIPELKTSSEAPKTADLAGKKDEKAQETPAKENDKKASQGSSEVLSIFLYEGKERLGRAQSLILDMEQSKEPALLQELFRIFHTFKGEAGFLGFSFLGSLAHHLESILDHLRQGRIDTSSALTDLLLDGLDVASCLLQSIETNKRELAQDCSGAESYIQRVSTWMVDHFPPLGELVIREKLMSSEQVSYILEKQRQNNWQLKFGELCVQEHLLTQEQIDALLSNQDLHSSKEKTPLAEKEELPKEKVPSPDLGETSSKGEKPLKEKQESDKPASASKTGDSLVTVKADQVRYLIDMVGELMIRLGQMEDEDRDVQAARKILRNIQHATMRLGTVKVSALFDVLRRVMRDGCRQSGKEIDLEIRGGDIEVDRNLIERLNEPLMHLVRNSISHGIEEKGEVRKAAGKDPVGKITLEAQRKGRHVIISVSDDGKGLNLERIRQKALEKGLRNEDELKALSTSEIQDLIFLPGFSTAEKIDALSGRGVGMDVVRTMVESLRGTLSLFSEEGKGTRIDLSFPINMAIMEGMIVLLGERQFILPIVNVIEALAVQDGDFHKIQGGVQVLALRGQTLPVIDLKTYFHIDDSSKSLRRMAVIIESRNQRFAFLVDQVISRREIVLKPLGPVFSGIHGLGGGTILQGGKIALIVDVDEVIDGEKKQEPADPKKQGRV